MAGARQPAARAQAPYLHATVPSPLGRILLRARGDRLLGLYFVGQRDYPRLPGLPAPPPVHADPTAGEHLGRPSRRYRLVPGRASPLRQGPAGPASWALAAGQEPLDEAGEGCTLLQPGTPAAAMAVFEQARAELEEYWQARRAVFQVALDPEGTPFQKRVWQALLDVPLGATVSYGELGRQAGLGAGHGRAVGLAVGSNPISIIIPCHRVLASGGMLNGYGGGLARKISLLQLEGFGLR